MSATIHIFKPALDDLQNALEWYDSQSKGLELRFSKAINDRIKFISNNPEASPVRCEGFRGAQLNKFPFTIYYEYDDSKNIVFISAVLHDKRDRVVLKDRK